MPVQRPIEGAGEGEDDNFSENQVSGCISGEMQAAKALGNRVWQILVANLSRVRNALWQNACQLNRETNNLPLESPSSNKPLRTGNHYDWQPRPTPFSNDAPTSIWTRPPRVRKWNNCHPQPSNQIRTTPKPYTSSKLVLPCLITISGISKRTCWCCVCGHLVSRLVYILFPSYPSRFG